MADRADRRRRTLLHVRRYPRWYAAALLWVIGMIALPVVTSRPLAAFASPPITTGQEAELPLGIAPTVPGLIGELVPPVTSLTPGTTQPPSGEEPLPEPQPPEFVEPTMIDRIFDLVPAPPALPELPPDLLAIVRAAAPIAAEGCTGLGLASLVVAVVAPSAEGVPIERILPYLAPVTSACAYFPIPEKHTVCEADKPFITDVGGLTKTPPILGLGIDQLTAMEDLMIERLGDSFPRFSDTARETLNCELVTE